MRILVLSDSHHLEQAVLRAIEQQPEADTVIFLGDGADDIELAQRVYPKLEYHIVRGNCDFGSLSEEEGMLTAGRKRIFYTHGHTYSVKAGLSPLLAAARNYGSDVVLYGHTHIAQTDYEDGLYILNPGTVGGCHAKATYGTLDITPAGIVCNIVELR